MPDPEYVYIHNARLGAYELLAKVKEGFTHFILDKLGGELTILIFNSDCVVIVAEVDKKFSILVLDKKIFDKIWPRPNYGNSVTARVRYILSLTEMTNSSIAYKTLITKITKEEAMEYLKVRWEIDM